MSLVNQEPSADFREPSAENGKPSAENGEPSAENGEPSADNREPSPENNVSAPSNSNNMEKATANPKHEQIISMLRELLNTGDDLDRCNAIRSLVGIQANQAIPEIIDFLHDEDIDVCIDATEALGTFQAKEAIQPLLSMLLNDPEGEVKTAATKSLGKIGGQEVEQALIKIAKDRPEDMDWSSNDDWDDWWDIQKEAVVALGELGSKEAIPLLVEMVQDEYSQDIQIDLLKALAKIGGKADKKLIKLLDLENFSGKLSNADKNLRRRIITAMAVSDSDKTLKALGQALTDKYAEVRAEAILSIAARKADAYLTPIMLMLRDPEPEVKEAALKAIKQLSQGNEEDDALEADQLVQLLKQNNETLQLTIINTLLSLTKQNRFVDSIEQLSKSSQALIRTCLTNKQISIVGTAAQILGRLKDRHSLPFLIQLFNNPESLPLVRQEVIRAISYFYESEADARDLINAALFDKEQSVRLSVADSLLLASNRIVEVDEEMLPPMEVLLATINGEKIHLDENSEQQEPQIDENEQLAIKSIKEQFSESEIEDSKSLIPDNQDEPVRESMSTLDSIAMDNVESALAAQPDVEQEEHQTEKAQPSIPASLIDPEDQELAPYIDVMQQNKQVARKMVRQKVSIDDDARYICVRLAAQNQQAQYNQDILETLNQALNDDDAQLRCEAAKAMAVMNANNPDLEAVNYSFGKLITLLDSSDEEMRLASINALAQSRNRAALPHLIAQFQNSNYIATIHSLEAIGKIIVEHQNLSREQQEFLMDNNEINDEQLAEQIKPLLTHKEYSVRMAAVETLVKLNKEEMIPVYIEVGLSGQAQLTAKVAKLLKNYAPHEATKVLLEKISQADNSALRGHMMEILVILNQEI